MSGYVRLTDLTPPEQEAVRLILGRPYSQSRSITVNIPAVDKAIRAAGLGASLRNVLEVIDGPIKNIAEARESSRLLWGRVVDDCSERLGPLLKGAGGVTLIKRLSKGDPARAARLCHHANLVLARLPAQGLSRAKLAADTLGDAHALDPGQAVATLVLAVLRLGAPDLLDDHVKNLGDDEMERSRDVWATVGILVNEFAKPVLHLNLPPRPYERVVYRAGEPGFFSWRQLARDPAPFDVQGRAVFICENANVVSFMADQLGEHCAPLVCTDGQLGAAQRALLTYLQRDGARLFYHGDYDWMGIQIANHVMTAFGALPWRLGAKDYLDLVDKSPTINFEASGTPVVARWDHRLTQAMSTRKQFRAEESMVEIMLDDLRIGNESRPA